jgi:hypothetical protein
LLIFRTFKNKLKIVLFMSQVIGSGGLVLLDFIPSFHNFYEVTLFDLLGLCHSLSFSIPVPSTMPGNGKYHVSICVELKCGDASLSKICFTSSEYLLD